MNFINKTTSARRGADEAMTDRRVTRVSLSGVDERGKFARLRAERKRVPSSDPDFLKRDNRRGSGPLIAPEGRTERSFVNSLASLIAFPATASNLASRMDLFDPSGG